MSRLTAILAIITLILATSMMAVAYALLTTCVFDQLWHVAWHANAVLLAVGVVAVFTHLYRNTSN